MRELKEKLEVAITDISAKIVDVSWTKQNGNKVLQVVIDGINQAVDLDLCTKITQIVDPIIDEYIKDDDYFLEVCSSGVDKAIENEEQRQESIGKYVHVKFNTPIHKLMEIKGILEYENNEYKIVGFIKGAKKTFKFSSDNIASMQLSVKI